MRAAPRFAFGATMTAAAALAVCAALASCGVPAAALPAGAAPEARAAGTRAADLPADADTPDAAVRLALPDAAYALPTRGKATVLAVGDVLLTRHPGTNIQKTGYQTPFSKLTDAIRAADLAFVNLECPASFVGTHYPGKPDNVTFRASPGVVFSLKWAGFDVVSLANNHMNDYGPQAVLETLDYFDLSGLKRCGAGADIAEARTPAVATANGLSIAFLAYAEGFWSVTPAGPSSPGVAHAIVADLVADVKAARAAYDHVFVSVHWGDEHQRIPRAFQLEFGRAAIDAGASVVLGHHPHVLQSVERYKSGLILYSMGNFVFDMAADPTYQSALFRVALDGNRVERVEIEPVTIDRGSCVPRPATPEEAKATLDGLATWSARFGTKVEIEGGKGYVFVPR